MKFQGCFNCVKKGISRILKKYLSLLFKVFCHMAVIVATREYGERRACYLKTDLSFKTDVFFTTDISLKIV